MQKLAMKVVLVAVYLAGAYFAMNLVQESCTHWNCKHGWYSKYNDTEKNIALAWLLGFPIVAYFAFQAAALYLDDRRDRRREASLLAVTQAVEQAIASGSRIEIDYVDAEGKPSRRQIQPIHQLKKNKFDCVEAHCQLRGEKRIFRLSRIQRATVVTQQ